MHSVVRVSGRARSNLDAPALNTVVSLEGALMSTSRPARMRRRLLLGAPVLAAAATMVAKPAAASASTSTSAAPQVIECAADLLRVS